MNNQLIEKNKFGEIAWTSGTTLFLETAINFGTSLATSASTAGIAPVFSYLFWYSQLKKDHEKGKLTDEEYEIKLKRLNWISGVACATSAVALTVAAAITVPVWAPPIIAGVCSFGAGKLTQTWLDKKEKKTYNEPKMTPEQLYQRCCKILVVSPEASM